MKARRQPRRCAFCNKTLPRDARSDARYCRNSRCRTGGWRRQRDERAEEYRRQHPERGRINHRVPPLRSYTQRVLHQWQMKRVKFGWQPLTVDPWCQAAAEEKAYELMIEHCKQLKEAAYTRKWNAQRPYTLDISEHKINHYGHSLDRKATHVGLMVLPPECGGIAILVVGEKR